MGLDCARFWRIALCAGFFGIWAGPAMAQSSSSPPQSPALVYCSCLCAGAEGNIECKIPIANETAANYYNGLASYNAFGPNARIKMISECAQPKVCQQPKSAVDLSGQHITSRPFWGSATMVLESVVNSAAPPYKAGETIDVIGAVSDAPNALFLFPATEPSTPSP